MRHFDTDSLETLVAIVDRGGFTAAGVSAIAVPAGIMASSRGSAIDAPTPLRTVRRDRCFLVRNTA